MNLKIISKYSINKENKLEGAFTKRGSYYNQTAEICEIYNILNA